MMEKICTICGNTYTKRKTCSKKDWDKSSCCSRECTAVHLSRLYKGKAPKNINEFLYYKRTPNLHVCAGCNQEFQYRKELNGAKTKYCTVECYKKYYVPPMRGKKWDARSGSKHHNWKGGITKENQKIRQSLEYKEWRTAVYTRDKYTCQICGQISGKINADHIKPFSLYPELRFDINNGRTLCVEYHKEHGWSFFKENNPRKNKQETT